MQRFRSYTAPHNATESQRSRWLGRWSISPVAAQNPLIHSAPLNRPHATSGGSCSRHPPFRPVDRQSEIRRRGLEIPCSALISRSRDLLWVSGPVSTANGILSTVSTQQNAKPP